MDTITIQIISFQVVALVAIIGFLWTLHRDMGNLRKEVSRDMADLCKDVSKDIADVRKDTADLRERMARMEGLLEGFVGRRPEPQS